MTDITRSTHGLLNTITESLKWTTVKNGSKSYVDAFLRTLPKNHHVHLGTKIRRVRRKTDGSVSLVFMDGSVEKYDHVVLAVHANQALDLLKDDATAIEKQILGSFQTSRNEVALHLDPTVIVPFHKMIRLSSKSLPDPPSQEICPSCVERRDTERGIQSGACGNRRW